MFYSVTAHSDDVEAASAIEAVIASCKSQLNGRTPKAAMLFASIDLEHDILLTQVNQAWPGIQLIGCTTDGEFSIELGFMDDSLVLTLFCSDKVEITAGIGFNLSDDIPAACRQAVEAAQNKMSQPPVLCITTPESLTTSMDLVVDSLQETLGLEVPLIGGTAGDQWRFKGTLQFCGTQVVSNAVPVLFFSSPLLFSFGVVSGWEPIGDPVEITRSINNVVYEIDGITALEYYRRYLGEFAKPTGENPIAIHDSQGQIQYLRASLESFNEQEGSITYLANVPEGSKIQLCAADRDGIIESCRTSVKQAYENYPEGYVPAAAICFSCGGRRFLLGTRTGEELEMLQEYIGEKVPASGFYTYGEIAPPNKQQRAVFHNETFITLLLGE